MTYYYMPIKLDFIDEYVIIIIIYFQEDILVLESVFLKLVLSYDFRKICWPDVLRENRFGCE